MDKQVARVASMVISKNEETCCVRCFNIDTLLISKKEARAYVGLHKEALTSVKKSKLFSALTDMSKRADMRTEEFRRPHPACLHYTNRRHPLSTW